MAAMKRMPLLAVLLVGFVGCSDVGSVPRSSFGGTASDATGTENGDLLEVRYSDMMQHSDYENAVYRRIE